MAQRNEWGPADYEREREQARERAGEIGPVPLPSSDTERMEQRAGEMTERMQGQAEQATEKVQELGDRGREGMAGGLERAAEQMRERGPAEGVQGQAMTKAAEGMERAAGYLQGRDTNEMLGDIERYVRSHPVQSVAMAVAAGFFVGRVLR